MKSQRINLCDMSNDTNHFELEAEVSGNRLTLIGEFTHLNNALIKKTGSSEYYYFLDEENTDKFFHSIHAKNFDLEAMKEKFNGLYASSDFREFCTANQIKYAFYNIA
ncbi:MAG: hypothetical protein J6D29_00795 [Solobacterium sp.]|nr:hypothetical protein [Solobacterium sp.]